jgi:hypothetical protein
MKGMINGEGIMNGEDDKCTWEVLENTMMSH